MFRSAHVDTFTRDNLPPPGELPEFLLDRPELRYPARLNAAVELLDRVVESGRGGAIALRTDEAACTYRQLLARVNQIAQVLRGPMGLVPGNRVLLRGPNSPMPGSLDALCAAQPARFEPCDTAQDDVAMIAFTSGTTGRPKGVMHFHRDVLAASDLFPRHTIDTRAADVFCGTPPLAFTFGLGGLLCFPLRVGASAVLIERLSPEALLAAIERHRATCCFTAPTYYRQMAALAHRHDLSSLRQCVSAGEALPDATRQAWKAATGIEITDGIGSTELFHMFIASSGDEVRRGAIGRPVPGYVARVVGDRMQALPPGEVGRLAVKGPTGCKYLADERQRNYVQQGWNLTGDVFRMDADGYFFYQARADDMIVSAGYNVAGPEVESALLLHEAVAECGVIGEPDEVRGQIVVAFVVPRPGMIERFGGEAQLASALQQHVKDTIAPYKYPRRVEFRDSLPRTETGKLQRFRLREGNRD